MIAEGEVEPADRAAPDRDQRGPLSRDHRAPRPRPCSPPPAGSPRWSPSASEAEEQALDAYGRNLGIAFQLVDDAIDYASDAATMGKGVGDDFRDGKVTLPVILAYARGSRRGPRLLARRDGRRAAPRTRISPTRSGCSRATGALDDTLERARHLRPARDRRARPLPRRPGQGGADRGGRVRDPPRLLMRPSVRRR